ncbi:MAG TPA: arylsulfatase [Bryobacteraceae bacterium]|nr:arylsulfatase [Bryobacteraceae bacterium]
MRRREFLAGLGCAISSAQTPAARPNIIFILADDLGYGDLGCYGQKVIQTPNIDRLAAEGVRFTRVYAGDTVCAPSRCALMTGKHTGHCRIRGNKKDVHLEASDVTVASVLKKAGYRTGIFGKWGLGGAGSPGIPNLQGFDQWFGYIDQSHAHTYYPDHLWEDQREFYIPGNFSMKTVYSHDLLTPRAINFIEGSKKSPFFLYLAFTIPHANNELGNKMGNGMEVPDFGPYAGQSWPDQEKGFAAMITRMDKDIGKLMENLKNLGLDGNTLVIFSSDNGAHREGGHDPEFFHSHGPLRGIKRDLYEGGIRTPAIARWPGRIKAGQVSDQVWAFWDFLPTAAELAGAEAPKGIDGISMVNALLGKKQRNHEYLYWEFHERGFSQAVRMDNWKGVRLGARSKPVELFDLSRDIGEKNDVAGQNPDVAAKIARIMDSARSESKEFPVVERSV